MSKTNKTTDPRPSAADTSTSDGPARTAAESRVWEALAAHPDSPAAELAAHAGAGKSTVGKILTRWAVSGDVTRTPGASDERRRTPDRWAIANSGTTPGQADGKAADNAASAADGRTTRRGRPTRPAATRPAAAAGTKKPSRTARANKNGNGRQRLPKGALRGLVEDFLREPERAGQDYTPGDIARKLERSAGAVSNCLDKLLAADTVEQTSEKPRRFRLSASAAEG